MALTVSGLVTPIGTKLVSQPSATVTADKNVTGAAGKLYQLDVDNSANGGAASYLKLYDDANPVPGTTAPDWIVKVPAGAIVKMAFVGGVDFAVGLSWACVTTGGTAGSTSPASAVKVWAVTT